MKLRFTGSTMLLAVAAVITNGARAHGQEILDGRTAFENGSIARSPNRGPGAMLSAGFGRAQATADAGRAQVLAPEITDEHQSPPRALFLADAIDIVFVQLNLLLAFFGSRILARAGLAPLLPANLFA